jgi:hypothetical protein
MSAAIDAPTGKEAGRVTIVTTLTSLIPPVAVSGVLILCAVLEIISHEVAGIAILTALGLGAATTGTVFTTAKHTPTDQKAVVFSSTLAGATGQTTPELPVHVEQDQPSGSHAIDVDEDPESPAAAQLRAELRQGGVS